MATYRDSGVDIDLAENAKSRIKEYVKSTYTANSVQNAGFFCGGIKLNLKDYKEPVLMASTDGVGTKMMVARMMNKFDTVGIDLVNHSANDLLTSGAKPLIFLDYIASEKIDPLIASELVKGIAAACKKLNIVLVGGETAQMPGVYVKGETDLAGTIVGVVDKPEIIDGSSIRDGDVIIAVASNGLHTNGYSLARKVLLQAFKINDYVDEIGSTIGEALLAPHIEYVSVFNEIKKIARIKGIAHITGGGMTDNIPRILPEGFSASINLSSWEVPPLFKLIQSKGDIPADDMLRTFNMGVGMVFVVGKEDAHKVVSGKKAWIIGEIGYGEGVLYYNKV